MKIGRRGLKKFLKYFVYYSEPQSIHMNHIPIQGLTQPFLWTRWGGGGVKILVEREGVNRKKMNASKGERTVETFKCVP